MKIYISGISGTGMGPLALMAKAAGLDVVGSDLKAGAILPELEKAGIKVKIGPQDGEFLKAEIEKTRNDTASTSLWFVHTSAVNENHAEFKLAKSRNLKITKRDELTAFLIEKLGLKMVAVAGTHGKTTTTSMIVYAALKLGLPVSYIVGTTLGFAPSGAYHAGDHYFIYEADEYDRNFLKFHPWLSVIPSATYDHPDIYPTRADYQAAFLEFKNQSENVVEGSPDEGAVAEIIDKNNLSFNYRKIEPQFNPNDFNLAGPARRQDAALAGTAIDLMLKDSAASLSSGDVAPTSNGHPQSRDTEPQNQNSPKFNRQDIIEILNTFPGVGRRFERIADGVYTDYAHHPEEVAATVAVARDECQRQQKKGVVVVYEPHQNTRQHEVRAGYREAFSGVKRLYWLPTYLTRENPALTVLAPEDFLKGLKNCQVVPYGAAAFLESETPKNTTTLVASSAMPAISAKPEVVSATLTTFATPASLGPELLNDLKRYQNEGYLILLMSAGPADEWLRENF